MNPRRHPSDRMQFDPPGSGLWPGEEIVWSRRAGTGFWIECCGFLFLIGSPILLVTVPLDFGITEVAPVLGGIVAGFVILLYAFLARRRTRYYLTDERIIEVHGSRIAKQIPLEHFAGKPMAQFLESRVTHTSNNRPIYTIRVYDPVSDMTMELKSLDGFSTSSFEKIGQVKECGYCGFDNVAISAKCKNCGANL